MRLTYRVLKVVATVAVKHTEFEVLISSRALPSRESVQKQCR